MTPGLLRSITASVDGADGLSGYDGASREDATAAIRIHEDGAVACGRLFRGASDADTIARMVNGMLLYVGWVHEHIAPMRNLIEVEISIRSANLLQLRGRASSWTESQTQLLSAHQPVGMNVTEIVLRSDLRSNALSSAPERHSVVRWFVDTVQIAFGESDKSARFDRGPLYDRDGASIDVALAGDRLYAERNRYQIIVLYDDDSLIVSYNTVVVGFVKAGVLLDATGDAVAVTEFATGPGCPTDFVTQEPGQAAWRDIPQSLGTQIHRGATLEAPSATGRWSKSTLAEQSPPRVSSPSHDRNGRHNTLTARANRTIPTSGRLLLLVRL